MFRKFAKFLCGIIFGLLFNVKLTGRENIPDKGPLILCANHKSMTDMFFITCWINRWVYWMSKIELHKNKLMALILKMLGSFPVRRGRANATTFKTAYKLLDEGHVIGIFPQGTRVRPKKPVPVVRDGAALIALKKNVNVLPVSISGDVKLFGKITVNYGKPIHLGDCRNSEISSELLSSSSKRIMDEINKLLGEKR